MEKDKPEHLSNEPEGLSTYLMELRREKGFSLRAVEEMTERAVSNAYLSQLEHGKIKKPSPNVLYSLAKTYGVEYDTLMSKAGYRATIANKPENRPSAPARLSINDLTDEEANKLREYLAFLRSQKGNGS